MEGLVTLPLLSSQSLAKILLSSKVSLSELHSRNPSAHGNQGSILLKEHRKRSSTRLYAAGLSEIEPDLNEDFVDRWRTNGAPPDEFEYGKWDGAHTYFESEEDRGSIWDSLAEEYTSIGPPTGFQGLISWLFPPAIAAGMYFHAPGEYLYIGAAIFAVVFCAIEMAKPSEAHNFEPQIYNMERGARDKLIADYNTMDIWDFNEKYGDLWDFTVKKDKDDIMKR